MIEFAGHHFSEDAITSSWPPRNEHLNEAFAALGKLMSFNVPLLESIRGAADCVANCPASVYLLRQLYRGLREAGTISGTLGSIGCGQKLAFKSNDRRLHLIHIGEECGNPDVALQIAAQLPEAIVGVQDSVWNETSVAIDDDLAFFFLAAGLYFEAAVPPIVAFEKLLVCFAHDSTIKESIEEVIVFLKQGCTVSESFEKAYLFLPALAKCISNGERQNQLESTLIRLANLANWPF